ncbi:protein FAM163B [Scleropages formosus]|uniref:Family with sequence similarity 163 member B n=1 Tax=Scleropages formosus TaxID=113540 RepID=A0A8C9SIH8_SCLFO|nr:protein FAM163B-like [Scleropages formosus]
MTAGTVVITGGILATVILLCIIIVLCYCRLQYYCCKEEELESDSESEEGEEEDEEEEEEQEEPSFGTSSRFPRDAVAMCAANGPCAYPPAPPPRLARSHTFCPSCMHHELPGFGLRPQGLRNGGQRLGYRTVSPRSPGMPIDPAAGHKLQLARSSTMKEMFSHGHSFSTDV